MKAFLSDVSNKEFPMTERVSAKVITHSILKRIQKDVPAFTHESYLSMEELDAYKEKSISDYMRKEIGELSEREKTVLISVINNRTLTDKVVDEDRATSTLGQQIADRVASFGGSWTFIMSFGVFILVWISANVFWIINKGFDPYPFILLNLILSCMAALQAPVIMMSQNRQEEKDRNRAKKDYMINLKSELEIRTLNEKLDHFIMHQQQEFMELQNIQSEMMNEILKQVGKANGRFS